MRKLSDKSIEVLFLIHYRGYSRVKVSEVLSRRYHQDVSVNRVRQLEQKGLKDLMTHSEIQKYIASLYCI